MTTFSTFFEEVERLNQDVLQMGKLVSRLMNSSINCLIYGDKYTARKLIKKDKAIDQYDEEINARVFQLITIQPPLPEELKNLSAIIRIIRELERIGDNAVNISEITQSISLSKEKEIVEVIQNMQEIIDKMLIDSLISIKDKSVEVAKSVERQDDKIDQMFLELQEVIINKMKNSKEIESLVPWLLVNRFLERSADHIVNITRKVRSNLC